MDLLRGVAVILVVFNHAVKFTADSFAESPHAAVISNEIFAPARMPLMVFLSGLLLQRSLAKGASRHIRGKVKAVLYPLGVWTLLIVGYDFASDVARGRLPVLMSPVDLVLAPPGHVWFLLYLFLFYLAALLLYRVPSWLFVTASLAACAIAPLDWNRFLLLFAFFFLGHVFATRARVLDRLISDWRIVGSAGLVALALPLLAVCGVDLRYDVASAPFVMAAIVLAIRFGRAVAGRALAAPFEYAGKLSLVFYLAHWFPTLAAVLASRALLPTQPYIAVFAGLVAGLGVSLLVGAAYERTRLVRAFFIWEQRSRPAPARVP